MHGDDLKNKQTNKNFNMHGDDLVTSLHMVLMQWVWTELETLHLLQAPGQGPSVVLDYAGQSEAH